MLNDTQKALVKKYKVRIDTPAVVSLLDLGFQIKEAPSGQQLMLERGYNQPNGLPPIRFGFLWIEGKLHQLKPY